MRVPRCQRLRPLLRPLLALLLPVALFGCCAYEASATGYRRECVW